MNSAIELSIIVPVYNEEDSLRLFFGRLIKVLNKIVNSFELIFIDDGSRDNSIKILKNLKLIENRIKIIKFNKNYGMHPALSAGFKHARGRLIATMDADLQTDPEALPLLLNEMSKGYDIISGWRIYRKEHCFSRNLASVVFNYILSFLIRKRIHDIGCTFKIFRKEVITDIIQSGDLLAFTPRLKKYKYSEIKIKHKARLFGKSKFNCFTLIKQGCIMLFYIIREKFRVADIA